MSDMPKLDCESPHVKRFVALVNQLREPTNPDTYAGCQVSQKYLKVVILPKKGLGLGHFFACIDRLTGDVLLAVSDSSIAKGVRGNIFDDDNGRSALDDHGNIRHF